MARKWRPSTGSSISLHNQYFFISHGPMRICLFGWWFPLLRPAEVCAIDTCCHSELQSPGRLSGVVCSHWWLRYCLCSARLRCAFCSNQGWKKFNRRVEWCSMLMMIMLLLVLHVVELCILQQSVCYCQWLIFALLDLFLSGITVIAQFSSLT